MFVAAPVRFGRSPWFGVLKDSSARVGREQGTAVITTESYEMALPGVLITRKAPRHALSVPCGASPSPWFSNRDVGIGCAARQNDCVGTDAFVRPASERIIPIAAEERRFSAAMRQEEIRALAPARTRASECGMGRHFVSESSGVSPGAKSEAAGSPVPALRTMREGRGIHSVVVSADSKTRATRQGFLTELFPRWAGGPFKPDFGLSGAVRQLHRAFPPLAHACVRSIRTRFQLVPRRPVV
jgi:hypothetical protein